MKYLKSLIIYAIILLNLLNLSEISCNKNFLKKNEKNIKTKSETEKKNQNSNLNTVEIQMSSTLEKPMNLNHGMTEEEKYDLERANAMADFIF